MFSSECPQFSIIIGGLGRGVVNVLSRNCQKTGLFPRCDAQPETIGELQEGAWLQYADNFVKLKNNK
jgi:hypothetical protein